jgi:hypothetical protein
MPRPCFSYEAEVPLGIGNRSAAQRAGDNPRSLTGGVCFSYMPAKICFSYMPAGVCFSYSAGVPGHRSQSPTGQGGGCFSYSADVPLGDLPRATGHTCFTY